MRSIFLFALMSAVPFSTAWGASPANLVMHSLDGQIVSKKATVSFVIQNRGDKTAPGSYVDVLAQDSESHWTVFTEKQLVPILKPGQSATLTVDVSKAKADTELTLWVDSKQMVYESNERDNTYAVTVSPGCWVTYTPTACLVGDALADATMAHDNAMGITYTPSEALEIRLAAEDHVGILAENLVETVRLGTIDNEQLLADDMVQALLDEDEARVASQVSSGLVFDVASHVADEDLGKNPGGLGDHPFSIFDPLEEQGGYSVAGPGMAGDGGFATMLTLFILKELGVFEAHKREIQENIDRANAEEARTTVQWLVAIIGAPPYRAPEGAGEQDQDPDGDDAGGPTSDPSDPPPPADAPQGHDDDPDAASSNPSDPPDECEGDDCFEPREDDPDCDPSVENCNGDNHNDDDDDDDEPEGTSGDGDCMASDDCGDGGAAAAQAALFCNLGMTAFCAPDERDARQATNPAINWGPNGPPMQTGDGVSEAELFGAVVDMLSKVINWGPDGAPIYQANGSDLDFIPFNPSVDPE
jgi:hypothetical protein